MLFLPRQCKLGDLPPHLQFNRHILSGYRPPMTAAECLGSLLYCHNESFNIYSHCEFSVEHCWSLKPKNA